MKPTFSVTGCTNVLNISLSTSHDAAVSTVVIETRATTLNIGQEISVNLGYNNSNTKMFTGFVKQIERKVPQNTYTITANDKMIRAIDYFIASADPSNPYKYQNLAAEDIVRNLMSMASLTNYTYTQSYFQFGVGAEVEVNLVSAYDYSKMIADMITWNLWADENGQVHFESRKPFVMYNNSGMPGDKIDVPINYTLTDSNILDINYAVSERGLRNRVVVYGIEGVNATAETSSPYLPNGYFKTAVMSAGIMITETSVAQQAADINLYLTNRLTYGLNVTVIGNPILNARKVINVNTSVIPLSGYWYIFSCEHNFSNQGYITNLTLRK
jgi:hypothetical protein